MGEKSAHRTGAAAPWEKLYLPLFRRYGVEISIKGFGCSASSSREQKCKSPALISAQFVMLSVCQCVLAAVPFWLKYSRPSSPSIPRPINSVKGRMPSKISIFFIGSNYEFTPKMNRSCVLVLNIRILRVIRRLQLPARSLERGIVVPRLLLLLRRREKSHT